jgi:2-succinyl-6-hydroxy-2,4-cyclohexadiene-1-carboxylate synthase
VEQVIHVFHGFLGSPEDFQFLKRDDVILHDVYAMNTYPVVGPDDILIGYSMGGRIALEIAEANNYNLKKIILINAHPGLDTEEEKLARAHFEETIIQKLKSRTLPEFMEYWNDLPIFFHDAPLTLNDQTRFEQSADLFDRYRLSKQRNHLPKVIEHKNKVLWIVGLFDEKYMDLVSEILMPNDIPVKGIPGGHRLFQQERELKEVLKQEGIF